MKPSRLLAAILTLTAMARQPVRAQEAHGFLNMVNLAPGARCRLHLGAHDVLPAGLPPGQATGWFIVPAARHSLAISLEGHGKAAGGLALAPAESSLCVVFLQPSRHDSPLGQASPPRIRFKRCNALAKTKGFSLTLLSFCPQDTPLLISKRPVTARWLESREIEGWNGTALAITHDGQLIGQTPEEHEPGAFYLFIGTDGKGNYCHALVRAEPQSLPPWMKPAGKPANQAPPASTPGE